MESNKKSISIVLLLLIATSILYSFSKNQFNDGQQTKDEIIGTWISEKDTNWKMEFTRTNNCYWYYKNNITKTFTYKISKNSCNNEFDSEYEYLKLNKTSKIHCYAINGITKDDDGKIYLSLEYDGRPRPMLFVKK